MFIDNIDIRLSACWRMLITKSANCYFWIFFIIYA